VPTKQRLENRTLTHLVFLPCFAVVLFGMQVFTQAGAKVADRQQTARPPMASLNGRAFLITKGGDIKPVRMGTVYLFGSFPYDATGKLLDGQHNPWMDAGRESPGVQLVYCDLEAAKSSLTQAGDAGYLLAYKTLLKCAEGIVQSHGSKKVGLYKGTTDEEGNFSFEKVPVAEYEVMVLGHAGIYEGLWRGDVVLRSGKASILKLSLPKYTFTPTD
jgi:hypothetical protein